MKHASYRTRFAARSIEDRRGFSARYRGSVIVVVIVRVD